MLAVAIAVIAGVIAWGAGRGPKMQRGDEDSGVLLKEDFSEVSERWSPDDYAGITSEITDGGYRVSLARRNQSWREATSFSGGIEHPAVVITATVVVEAAADDTTVGVTCESNPGDADDITGLFGHYEGVIALDGRARIVRNLNDDEEVLARSDTGVELRAGEAIDLELTCVNADDETKVSLEVNGERVVEAMEQGPLAGFEGAGMSAAAAGSGLEVVFDELEAVRSSES